MPSATRIGSGFGAPGSCGTSARACLAAERSAAFAGPPPGVVIWSAGIDRQLPSVSEDTLWSEDHQQHQPQAHQDEAHGAGLVRIHEPARDERVAAGSRAAEERP